MSALHVRNVDDETLARLKARARLLKTSVNAVAVACLQEAIGTAKGKRRELTVHHDLDDLLGTWSQKDLAEFDKAVARFEQIDEELWK